MSKFIVFVLIISSYQFARSENDYYDYDYYDDGPLHRQSFTNRLGDMFGGEGGMTSGLPGGEIVSGMLGDRNRPGLTNRLGDRFGGEGGMTSGLPGGELISNLLGGTRPRADVDVDV